jgi:chemotaxis protein histidine kinase CheA
VEVVGFRSAIVQADKQQQIIGFFIEEANDHLNTLEDGLLNLQTSIEDPESINEMFRAAHSVKGGAAMLGFGSIQKTAHHLEDCLKILKEQPVAVDQQLVSLFLRSFDTLKKLTEELQAPFGLQADKADEIVKASEPTFAELERYLNHLVGLPVDDVPAVPADFAPRVMTLLKQMLALFKEPDSPTNRQKLQGFCGHMSQLAPSEATWQMLVKAAAAALANPANTYQALAPIVIKDLKQASELLQAGRTAEVTISQALQKLSQGTASAKPAAQTTKPAAQTASVSTATQAASSSSAAASKSAVPSNVSSNMLQVPVDPKAAAKVLIASFNKQQLMELTKLLIAAVKQQA